MRRRNLMMFLLIIVAVLAIGYWKIPENGTESLAEVPNPAATYCERLGHGLEIRSDEEGNQYGVCIFPDGSECNEWDFYRGECGQKFTFCEQHGFEIESRTEDMGDWTAKYAVCVFDDGSECLERDYFEDEC